MKSISAKLLKALPIVVGLLLAAGCANMVTGRAHVIRLKVVDAKTSQPLSGVSAVWREDLDDMTLGHFQTGPTNLASSDGSGLITIDLVHPHMTGRLILSRFGYTTAYGIYSDGALETSDNIQPPPMPQDVFTLDDEENAGRVNGSFLIRMHQ